CPKNSISFRFFDILWLLPEKEHKGNIRNALLKSVLIKTSHNLRKSLFFYNQHQDFGSLPDKPPNENKYILLHIPSKISLLLTERHFSEKFFYRHKPKKHKTETISFLQ